MDDLAQLDRPNAMSWPYIAGFVDGEGTIRIQGAGVQVIAYQSKERGRRVLEEIQKFLLGKGIRTSIYLRRDDMYCLYACGREGAVPMMLGMFPYLRIKKLEAQDVLRYLKLFPIRNYGPVHAGILRDHKCGRHGNHVRGQSHHASKLTSDKVIEIRNRAGVGELCSELAKEFGVSSNTISRIKLRLAWKHLN